MINGIPTPICCVSLFLGKINALVPPSCVLQARTVLA